MSGETPVFKSLTVPSKGQRITIQNGKLNVPKNPVIPFIEGDGVGVDVTPVMRKVADAAVAKATKKVDEVVAPVEAKMPAPVREAANKAREARTKVHATGIPWNDPSGERLRS